MENRKPSLKILPKEHFWVSGLKRAFSLTGVVPLYLHVIENLENLERNENLEFNTGYATYIYSLDENNNIHLITGWKGHRK